MTDEQHLTRNQFEQLLRTILEIARRIEKKVEDVAIDVDAIDRFQRPFGDGSKTRRPRR